MENARQKLEPSAAKASQRLEKIWLEWKAAKKAQGVKASMEQTSLDLGWSTSMFGQYTRGSRSIGLEALIRISRYFSVPMKEIYPELVERVGTWWIEEIENVSPHITPPDDISTTEKNDIKELSGLFIKSDDRGRETILTIARLESCRPESPFHGDSVNDLKAKKKRRKKAAKQ